MITVITPDDARNDLLALLELTEKSHPEMTARIRRKMKYFWCVSDYLDQIETTLDFVC